MALMKAHADDRVEYMFLFLFASLLGLIVASSACSSSPSSKVEDGGLADAASANIAPLGDASIVDASFGALCPTCIAQRCDAQAQSCYADPACLGVYDCLRACTTPSCDQMCSGDASELSSAESLIECETQKCALPCSGIAPPSMCVTLTNVCDPLETTCCDGTCPAEGGNCCYALGHACSDAADCCLDATGLPAECNDGVCAAQTCFMSHTSCEATLPCCDARLSCTSIGILAGSICCAPDGTMLGASEFSLCCSAGIMTNADGSITCVAPPPS
jgi:hypothetical protein